MEYRLQSMYNHMVGRTVSVISPFFSLLPAMHLGERREQLVSPGVSAEPPGSN